MCQRSSILPDIRLMPPRSNKNGQSQLEGKGRPRVCAKLQDIATGLFGHRGHANRRCAEAYQREIPGQLGVPSVDEMLFRQELPRFRLQRADGPTAGPEEVVLLGGMP